MIIDILKKYKYTLIYIVLTLVYIVLLALFIAGVMYAQKAEIGDKSNVEETSIQTTPETEEITFEPIETEAPETEAETTEPETVETAAVIAQICENIAITDDNDLLYLAKIVENEAGSSWCTDEHQRAVASVVLNRVNDARFPDTLLGVITQGWNGECPLQYAVGGWERFNALDPSERAIENARYVLEHGSTVPGAIWQAEFPQGTAVLAEFAYPEIYSGVTYICR